MGILDNFQGYANVNPNVAGIAQNLQTSMGNQAQTQRKNQVDWLTNLASQYMPASQGYQAPITAVSKELPAYEQMLASPMLANNQFIRNPAIANMAKQLSDSGAK